MARQLVSAEEIQQAIDTRINTQPEMLKDHAKIQVQIPDRTEPDADGCNWHADVVGDIAGHEAIIARAVAEVRGIYNLQE